MFICCCCFSDDNLPSLLINVTDQKIVNFIAVENFLKILCASFEKKVRLSSICCHKQTNQIQFCGAVKSTPPSRFVLIMKQIISINFFLPCTINYYLQEAVELCNLLTITSFIFKLNDKSMVSEMAKHPVWYCFRL